MRRLLTSLLLMFCVCWQSLAYAGADVVVADGDEQVHAMLHFGEQAHHHDEHDGSFHQDESPASTQHSMDDACVFAPALIARAALFLLPLRPDVPIELRSAEPPLPFVRGLDRPPKPIA